MSREKKKLVIIGSGPAGLTAAIYASRAMLDVTVIAGRTPGGQLMMTTAVENFPGFSKGIQGPVLMSEMRRQAEHFGTKFVDRWADQVDFSGKVKRIGAEGKELLADAVLIATGSKNRWLGLPHEKDWVGRGISTCATCDGYFFRDQDIAVVGGGDSAMEEATFLTAFAKSVSVLVRGDALKASRIMQEKAFANPKIKFFLNTETTELLGKDKLEGLMTKNTKSGRVEKLNVAGLFLAIGWSPATDIFKGQVDVDEKGFIRVIDEVKTSVEGVFVAGDVSDPIYKQAVYSAGMGCRAALEAQWYLDN
ncbi:MAG: thioredoxin reductase (NADPH) [Parcubacteria group bacterium Gr01-1014_18]|nr:MAG: thioredoxin reductase (NADPH) [Parcubacteria group bacterium Greene0416_36]TSC80114.1 MAG: thioredoxin reductase (NADPH) [Parcubacteria group bacterium Gr01-1014_18]TSC98596.1 MAG: thioredoxin reductase (NADPH) [Parcubacteria group bacterium Greene1014_20]TSD06423.1 MAG: thioredoxin reductase (NADPH) [Parcubacteria group bacterium Greene0714_2]